MSKRILLLFGGLAALSILLTAGCSNRPATAQKLFEKGEYQQVLDKYPDLEVARRAKAKIAEQLLTERKYTEILTNYSDTPAAFQARTRMAQQLYDAGRFQAVLDSFPGSSVAAAARDRIVDSLITVGQLDTLFKRFPDAPRATVMKDSLAALDLEKAKKMRGTAREEALDALAKKWPGTASYKEATRMLQEARAKKK